VNQSSKVLVNLADRKRNHRAMQIILSILLYLGVISSPGTYYVSQINNDVVTNQASVNTVKSDPALLQSVINTYQTSVSQIVILDDGQLKVSPDGK